MVSFAQTLPRPTSLATILAMPTQLIAESSMFVSRELPDPTVVVSELFSMLTHSNVTSQKTFQVARNTTGILILNWPKSWPAKMSNNPQERPQVDRNNHRLHHHQAGLCHRRHLKIRRIRQAAKLDTDTDWPLARLMNFMGFPILSPT